MDAYARSLKRIEKIKTSSQSVLTLSRQVLRLKNSGPSDVKAQLAAEFLEALRVLEKTIKQFYKDLDQMVKESQKE